MGEIEDRLSAAETGMTSAENAQDAADQRSVAAIALITELAGAVVSLHGESDVDQARIRDASDRVLDLSNRVTTLVAQQNAQGLPEGLEPDLAAAVAAAHGYSVDINNYDAAYTWSADSTEGGSTTITDNGDGTATVAVTGIDAGVTAVLTVTTTRSGYQLGSKTVSGSSNP